MMNELKRMVERMKQDEVELKEQIKNEIEPNFRANLEGEYRGTKTNRMRLEMMIERQEEEM